MISYFRVFVILFEFTYRFKNVNGPAQLLAGWPMPVPYFGMSQRWRLALIGRSLQPGLQAPKKPFELPRMNLASQQAALLLTLLASDFFSQGPQSLALWPIPWTTAGAAQELQPSAARAKLPAARARTAAARVRTIIP